MRKGDYICWPYGKKLTAEYSSISFWLFIGIKRTFHPKAMEYIFSLSAHEVFSRVNDMLGNKTSLRRLKSSQTSIQPQWYEAGNQLEEEN